MPQSLEIRMPIFTKKNSFNLDKELYQEDSSSEATEEPAESS